MREIKFRAWDKKYKQMWFPSLINVGNNSDDYDSLYPCPFGDDDYVPHYPKEAELMQFTGLRDKNGKEIYEGDILRLTCSSNENHAVTATVEWVQDGYVGFVPRIHDKRVKVVGGSMDRTMQSMREIHTWCGSHYCFSYRSKLEVIGNIYQNPELLTNK